MIQSLGEAGIVVRAARRSAARATSASPTAPGPRTSASSTPSAARGSERRNLRNPPAPWYKPWSMNRASTLAFSIAPQGLRPRAWFYLFAI